MDGVAQERTATGCGIGLLGWPVSESGRLCQGAGGLGTTDGATAPPDGANVVYALRERSPALY